MAGEISERKGESKTAVEYYAKGNNFARAVQLAREVKLYLIYQMYVFLINLQLCCCL